MEATDYSNYFNPSQQPYQWFGADNITYTNGDGSVPTPVSEAIAQEHF
jgi:hypothetical protein